MGRNSPYKDGDVVESADGPVLIRDGVLLFWDGWPSNWFPAPFTLAGQSYNCAEQFMMAEKARHFHDKDTLARILAATHPADQKRLGRSVKGYDDQEWARVRSYLVTPGIVEKFRQNPDLMARLLRTRESCKVIAESSPADRIWGTGLDMSHEDAARPDKWPGKNLLGDALMWARADLHTYGGLRT